MDVVVTAVNSPAKLFRNVTASNAHWLALRLRGVRSNRQGLGTKVQVRLPDGQGGFALLRNPSKVNGLA